MISIEQFEKELDLIIKNGYREDVGDGDHTSLSCIPSNAQGKANLLVNSCHFIYWSKDLYSESSFQYFSAKSLASLIRKASPRIIA